MDSLFSDTTGLLAVFLACLFSGLGLPWPEDLPLLVAGWQVKQGLIMPAPTLAITALAVLGRDSLAFSIGHLLRLGMERPWVKRFLASRRFARAQDMVRRSHSGVLIMARLLAGFRVPLYIAAGVAGLSVRRFLSVEIPGVLLMVPATLWLGWRYGEDAEHTVLWLIEARWPLVCVAAVVILAAGWRAWRLSHSSSPVMDQ